MVEVNNSKQKESKILINNDPHKNNDLSPNKSKTYQCSKDSLVVLHQNIRGLQNKRDELLISLYPNPPQVICLSEHHLKNEIETLTYLLTYLLHGAESFLRS